MNRTYTLIITLVFILGCFTSCKDDPEPPVLLPAPETGTLTMTTDHGEWTTATVKILDQGNSTLSLRATSEQGGRIDLVGIFYSGIGIYDYESNGLGISSMMPDTTLLEPVFSHLNPSGTFTLLSHDIETDKFSGEFDLYILNANNANDSVHLLGSFEEVEVKPASSELQQMNVSIDGTPFLSNYIVSQVIGNTVLLHMVQDVRKRVVMRIERTSLSAGTYTLNSLNNPIGFSYINVYQEYFIPQSGNAEVNIHYPGNSNSNTLGATIGEFSVTLGDGGSTDPVLLNGNFDVEYGF